MTTATAPPSISARPARERLPLTNLPDEVRNMIYKAYLKDSNEEYSIKEYCKEFEDPVTCRRGPWLSVDTRPNNKYFRLSACKSTTCGTLCNAVCRIWSLLCGKSGALVANEAEALHLVECLRLDLWNEKGSPVALDGFKQWLRDTPQQNQASIRVIHLDLAFTVIGGVRNPGPEPHWRDVAAGSYSDHGLQLPIPVTEFAAIQSGPFSEWRSLIQGAHFASALLRSSGTARRRSCRQHWRISWRVL
jgi:hypothetical protein